MENLDQILLSAVASGFYMAVNNPALMGNAKVKEKAFNIAMKTPLVKETTEAITALVVALSYSNAE